MDTQYELLEKLGGGGMGNVYRARDKRLNRIVAIKLLRDAGRDPDRQRRFILEAQAASALNHPNIITIHDLVEQDGEQMMVMECVTGRSLLELIRDHPLTLEEVSHYGAQIADALAAAHAANIIHRDLKPTNVMVTDRGFVKVLDFGLAKMLAPEGSDITRSGSALTVEGTLLGTVAYMSPEQAQGKPVDARSDIFSFGAVLYEMVTGKRAFESGNVISTLTAILRDEARPIPELTANVPTELQAIVHYCLRKLPEERYQNMAQVRDALLALRRLPQPAHPPIAGPPPPEPPPPPPPAQPAPLAAAPAAPPAAPTTKKTRWALPVALLGLLAVGAGGWYFWSHRNPSPPPVSKTPPANPPAANVPGPTAPVPSPVQPPVISPPPISPPAQQTPKPETPSQPQPQPPPAAKSVTVPDGTPLRLTLAQEIAVDAPEGTPLAFVVDADLVVNGGIAIAKGAAAKGVIVEPGKKRRILRDLKAAYRLISVDAVDGKSLRVRTTPARSGDLEKRPLIGTSRGTPFPAYVDGDVTVKVP